MRRKRLKNLRIRVEILGLMIGITPFRWAPWAFKTQWSFLGRKQSTQLFAGPLHVWTFSRDGTLSITLGLGLDGSVHGTFTPSGDNALTYYWRKLTGLGWATMPQHRFAELVQGGTSEKTAHAFVEGEFGVNLKGSE
tara:strand:- start:252 stop:662 length:411 start_codon:yes stop_codon:yes gene_type:complete